MKKLVAHGYVYFVFDDLEEARGFLNGISTITPIYTLYEGKVIEIKNPRNPQLTLVVQADVRELGGEANESEGVRDQQRSEDAVL